MSRRQYDNFMLVRDIFNKEVKNIQDLIQIIIPQSEDDKQQFKLFLSLVTQLNDRMQKATNLMDVADIINFDELENDWEAIKENINFCMSRENNYVSGVISTGNDMREEDDEEEDY